MITEGRAGRVWPGLCAQPQCLCPSQWWEEGDGCLCASCRSLVVPFSFSHVLLRTSALWGENGMLKIKEFRLMLASPPVLWLCKRQSPEGKWLGLSVLCPRPPLYPVPRIRGDVGLKMSPHGRSRLAGVLVQRGLGQHRVGRMGMTVLGEESHGLCWIKQDDEM